MMIPKTLRSTKWPMGALALLLAVITMLLAHQEAFAQLPTVPLPPPPTLPPPPIVPIPPALPLGPPELPKLPSLPQVFPPNAPTTSSSTELPTTGATLDAKLLVISADGTEPVLGA